jgi:hypothetical protein
MALRSKRGANELATQFEAWGDFRDFAHATAEYALTDGHYSISQRRRWRQHLDFIEILDGTRDEIRRTAAAHCFSTKAKHFQACVISEIRSPGSWKSPAEPL